ncbi:MAG: AAA family ATPase [Thiovulaceae bacterium]|nr:AAA family ATPase [Sulfurimonadaceae bacterium]
MSEHERIISLLTTKQNVFLTGGAGTGKTTLTRDLIEHYSSEGKKTAKLASTGMAATLIGGQTLHSFLDLGIADSIEELERQGRLETKKKIKKLIASMDLIIIDEISMVSAPVFEMIRLRLLQSDFKGAILVVGDFLQLPPVVRGYGEIYFAFESESWQRFDFRTVTLEINHRSSDIDFVKVLDRVRFAEISDDEHLYLHHLIKPIGEDLSQYTYLYGKNYSASRHNEAQLAFIESDEMCYEAQVLKHDNKTTEKEIERFLSDARIEAQLRLKVGAPVLFTRNAWNYFNGERGQIVRLNEGVVFVEKSEGVVVKLERAAMAKTQWKEKTIEGKKEMVEEAKFSVHQYPIALAFAITIHKSQGMSIEDLIIETTEIFAPSQFYVALSRATSPHRLILKQPLTDWCNLAFVNPKALSFVQSHLSGK